MTFDDPFAKRDPWRPFDGNGYELNEDQFEDWYGMTPDEYIEECKRRGVPWVREEEGDSNDG